MKKSHCQQLTVFKMSTHFFHLPIFILTFLMASILLTSGQEISLVKEPEANYYIVKKIPVVIVCQARNAAEIAFYCLGTQIPATSVEVKEVSESDPDLVEAEIEVNRADVVNSADQENFWCQCSALDHTGTVSATSRKAYVSIASLKNKFGSQPEPKTVTVGEDVEFLCEAPEGHPKAEVFWRKDKKRLDLENNPRVYVSQKNSLVIQSVSTTDKGKYQCVARNVVGRIESQEAQLTVIALAESAEPGLEMLETEVSGKKGSGGGKLRATRQSIKTYFTIEPLENYYVSKGRNLTIDCGVVAADILTFNCNQKRMDRDRVSMSQGLDSVGNRVIQAQFTATYEDIVQLMQDQTYHCVCVAWYHEMGETKGWHKIESNKANGFVHLAYLEETFQAEPADVTAGLNSEAVLICEPPKGQPSPFVAWLKDGKRLDPRSNDKYSVNSKGHLTITNVQYEDAGVYQCSAQNSVGSAESKQGRLIVSSESFETTTVASQDRFPTFPDVIPSRPVFIHDFESEYTLGADGKKTLVCAVVSADQMTIECGGQRLPVEDYELKTEIHRETGKRLLHITVEIDEARIASNPDDYFCQCTAWFLNQQKTWEKIFNSKGYIRPGHPVLNEYIDDVFEVTPEDTEANYESEAEIFCRPPKGNPQPEVYWLKDGVRIDTEEDSNFVIIDGNLVIELVRVTDEGEYTCVAQNSAGMQKSQPVLLTVLGKPDIDIITEETDTEYEETTASVFETDEPAFLNDLASDYYIVKDTFVTLSCTVVGAKTLLFVCNDQLLRESITTGSHYTHPHTQQIIRENSWNITRDQVEKNRGSEPYTCLCRAYYQKKGGAPNDLLTIETSPAAIHIAYLDERFLLEPSDTEVEQFDSVRLLCTAPAGVPEPKISWLKDNYPIKENDKIRVDENDYLIIEEFSLGNEGKYICVANNTYDEVVSRAANVRLKHTTGDHTAKPSTDTDIEQIESGEPYISKDVHSVYYVVKNKPATITCEAYAVERITFTCNSEEVQEVETKERMEELPLRSGTTQIVKVVEASISVTKNDVEENVSYWCRCHAHYRVSGSNDYHKLDSIKGFVEIAYLKKSFAKEPESQTVEEGQSLSIQCQPPAGNPAPKVTWTKDGVEIEALSISPTNVLIFPEVEQEHAGEYICVAENDAGKRMSSPVIVTVKALDGSQPSKPEVQECPKLKECTRISSNSLFTSSDKTEISLQDLCEDTASFLECVDHRLGDCNVSKSIPDGYVRPSLDSVGDVLKQYCNRFVLNNEKTESCEELQNCEIHLEKFAADNTTYWCSILKHVKDCSDDAADQCAIDDLTNELNDFHSEVTNIYCKETIKLEPDVTETEEETSTNESDNKASSHETDMEPTETPEGGSSDGDEDDSNAEPGAEASQENKDGKASVTGVSILLTTCLQIVAVVCLSWR